MSIATRRSPAPPLRRGGLALAARAQAAEVMVSAAPTAGEAAAPTANDTRSVWQSLKAGVEFNLPFVGFLVYLATITTNRFTVAQPAVGLALVGLLGQRLPFRTGMYVLLFTLYALWAAVGAFASPYVPASSTAVTDLFKVLVVVVIGVNAIRTRAQVRFTTVFVLFWFAFYPGRGAYLNYITRANLKFGRVIWNGVYANPNDLAAITLLMLTLCAALVVSDRHRFIRLGAWAGIALLALLIAFTQSRGVLVALFVMGVLVFLTASGSGRRMKTVVGAVAASALFAVFAPASMWQRVGGMLHPSDAANKESLDRDSSARQRLAIWRVARTIIAEHPVTGVGLGGYPRAHLETSVRPQFQTISQGARDTHSTYLNVMAEVGVPGFALLIGMALYVLVDAETVRRRRRRDDPLDARALLMMEIGFVGFLVAAIWASYAKLNMFYIMLLFVWVRTRALDEETPALAAPADAGPSGARAVRGAGRPLPLPAA